MLVRKQNNRWVPFGCLAVAMLLGVPLAPCAPGPSSAGAPQYHASAVPPFPQAAPATPSARTTVAAAGEGNAAVPSQLEKPKVESCLGCHGPFEKLAERTAAYVTDQGEKVNPHVYVPHHSNKVPACNVCHDDHPLPSPSPGTLAKASVQYCYSACHHVNDFTPCVQCHKDKK